MGLHQSLIKNIFWIVPNIKKEENTFYYKMIYDC